MAPSSKTKSEAKTSFAPGSEVDRWVLRFTEGPLSPEDARAFNQWLLADPDNEQAFERAQEAYERATYLRNDPRLEDWLKPSPYERLASMAARMGKISISLARPRYAVPVFGGLTAALAAAAALFLMTPREPIAPLSPAEPELVTQVAEIREEALPDGSTVTLGAASSIDVQFSNEVRRVVLLEGEAFFDVEHDPQRPFLVAADDMLVRVLGTKFDVSLGTGAVDVAVSEGRVEVIRPDAFSKEIDDSDIKHVLTAGQKVTATNAGPVRAVETIAIDEVALWREGELVWENTAIRDIISDLNRYSGRRIVLRDNRLANLEYTFSFRADDVDLAVDVIADSLGVRMVEGPNGVIELR